MSVPVAWAAARSLPKRFWPVEESTPAPQPVLIESPIEASVTGATSSETVEVLAAVEPAKPAVRTSATVVTTTDSANRRLFMCENPLRLL